jgi:hypothetical protein
MQVYFRCKLDPLSSECMHEVNPGEEKLEFIMYSSFVHFFNILKECHFFDILKECHFFDISKECHFFDISKECHFFDISKDCNFLNISKIAISSIYRKLNYPWLLYIERMPFLRYIKRLPFFQYVENSKLSMVSIHQRNHGIVSIYRRNDILSNSICEKPKGCHVLPKQAMF